MANTTKIALEEQTVQEKKKTCFIIMPISDQDGYEPGHFKRVYEFIIKPACIASGYEPTRADDVAETNLIALDIIKRIVDSDMAICDLSSKNPNVLYEAGIRQAFNYPIVFIKDFITPRIFDIQGFRDVSYDESLRIDTIDPAVKTLTLAIKATAEKKEGINSLISLLGITAAELSKKEISGETELILRAIKNMEVRLSNVEQVKSNRRPIGISYNFSQKKISEEGKLRLSNGDRVRTDSQEVGIVIGHDKQGNLLVQFENGLRAVFGEGDDLYFE